MDMVKMVGMQGSPLVSLITTCLPCPVLQARSLAGSMLVDDTCQAHVLRTNKLTDGTVLRPQQPLRLLKKACEGRLLVMTFVSLISRIQSLQNLWE